MSGARESALDSTTGWVLVALGVTLLTLVWGAVFTFTVYADQLGSAFGLSELRVSTVFSVMTGAFFVAGGTLGILIARVPLRPVVAAGGVAIAAATGFLQVASSFPGVAVAFGVIGAAAGTLFVIVLSLVPQWFDVYEGRAMGITLTGNGIGVLVMPFVWVRLFERFQFRTAFAVVAGAITVVVLLASVVYRRPPGVRAGETDPVGLPWLRRHLSDRRFLVALVGFPFVWAWYFVLSSQLVGILASNGIARAAAATAFATVGGISVLTRVGSGAIADVTGPRITLASGVTFAALAVFALVVVTTQPLMYVALVVFGIGLGAIAALFSPVVVGAFGPENATAIVGIFTLAESTTAFFAPIAVNALVDLTGGYLVPLVALGGATLAGAGMFYWGTAPPQARGTDPEPDSATA